MKLSCCFDCLFFIAEAIQLPPQEEPKKKVNVIDLTQSDSADEEDAQLKCNKANKTDCSKQSLNSAAGSMLHSYYQWEIKVLQLIVERLTNILLSMLDSITWFSDLIVSSVEMLPDTGVKERREGKIFKVSGYLFFREIQTNQ